MGAEDDFEESSEDKLRFAAQTGNRALVEEMLAKGARVDAFDELGKSSLIYAAEGGHVEVVELLLKAGADVNACDASRAGDTALGAVAATCGLELARILIEAGADPTIPGSMGITPLHKAMARQRGEGPLVYDLLRRRGMS